MFLRFILFTSSAFEPWSESSFKVTDTVRIGWQNLKKKKKQQKLNKKVLTKYLVGFQSISLLRKVSSRFPGGTSGKESTANSGDTCSILGWGRSPREGNGNPLQYSCLGNPMDRGAWWATVHVVAKDRTWQSTPACMQKCLALRSRLHPNNVSIVHRSLCPVCHQLRNTATTFSHSTLNYLISLFGHRGHCF